MELVYLWVEKYKNIEKQGFHFSPRFKCVYNEKANELTIDENEDYQLSIDETKQCEIIIKLIGEPIIKRQLQEMLDSKRLAKVDEIDTIKKQIKDLQDKLETKQGNDNDKK